MRRIRRCALYSLPGAALIIGLLAINTCAAQNRQPVEGADEVNMVSTGSYGLVGLDSIQLNFAFPQPLGSVKLLLSRDPSTGRLLEGRVEFGDLQTLTLPESILSCLPSPLIRETTFSASPFPKQISEEWSAHWWNRIQIYYGETQYLQDEHVSLMNIYPAIEFEIRNMELVRARFMRSASAGDSQVLTVFSDDCPTDLISWSLTPE